MSQATSLIDFLLSLLQDPGARQEFLDNPDDYLAECGIDHVSAADLHDALLLMQESQDASFDRDFNSGGNSVTVATPPPPPAGDDHEDAVQYLNNYITHNYVDDRDTNIDASVNQQIDTDGGDFDQTIDIDPTVASGDGAVAAGGDIEDSNIATGEDSVAGEGNIVGNEGSVIGDDNEAVIGDENTTSFGDGDASSAEFEGDVNVGSGGGFSVGGDASGNDAETITEDSFNTTEDNDTTTETTTTFENSFTSDDDTETSSDDDVTTEIDSHTESHSNSHVDVDA